MASELVAVPNLGLSADEAKSLIASISDPADLSDIRKRAAVFEAYAETMKSREAYLLAGEIRLRAERRAGEIRRKLPRMPAIRGRGKRKFDYAEAKRLRDSGLSRYAIAKQFGVSKDAVKAAERRGWPPPEADRSALAEFDEQFGVGPGRSGKWQELAELDDEKFECVIADIKARDLGFTPSTALRLAGAGKRRTIERGIDEVNDGRLAIRWRKAGVTHSRVLDTKDVAIARRTLAELRGDIKEPVGLGGRAHDIDDGYAFLRRALQCLDTGRLHVCADSRRLVDVAIAELHRSEDSLIKAIRAEKIAQGKAK